MPSLLYFAQCCDSVCLSLELVTYIPNTLSSTDSKLTSMHRNRFLFCLQREFLAWVSIYLASELLSSTVRDRQRMLFRPLDAFDRRETEFFFGEERICSMCVNRALTPHCCISRIACSPERTNETQQRRDSRRSHKE